MKTCRIQLLIHVHVAVLYGKACIHKCRELEKFINLFLRNKYHQPVLTTVLKDHIHCLFFLNPETSLTACMHELMKVIRSEICQDPDQVNFLWDPCYYASTCNIQDIEDIIRELSQQNEYHNRFSYKDEQKKLLEEMLIAEIVAEEYE
ncbi:MAG TPA: hypothetical protein ENN58_03805 [bacterium]|nr:hypothetical protein [bacterium]